MLDHNILVAFLVFGVFLKLGDDLVGDRLDFGVDFVGGFL